MRFVNKTINRSEFHRYIIACCQKKDSSLCFLCFNASSPDEALQEFYDSDLKNLDPVKIYRVDEEYTLSEVF